MNLLRDRFVQRALAEREELQAAFASRDHDTAVRILHSMAGNAGMFGYPELSDAARALEQALIRGGADDEIASMLQIVLRAIPRRDIAETAHSE